MYGCNLKRLCGTHSSFATDARNDGASAPRTITKGALQEMIEKKTTPYVLVDVREEAELVHGRIPTAHHVPLGMIPESFSTMDKDDFGERFGFERPEIGGEEVLVFYCKGGVRSEMAARAALQAGYGSDQVLNYAGSFLDWYPDREY